MGRMSNKVRLSGVILFEPVLSEEINGEKIYQMTVRVARLSDAVDEIKVRVSDRFICFPELHSGVCVDITGSIRTRNVWREDHKRKSLDLTVFCSNIVVCEPEMCENVVELDGILSKESFLRRAKTGNRRVCEQLVRNDRGYNKCSFIPVVFWGRNAEYVSSLAKGTKVHCTGRLQSRRYFKRTTESGVSPIEGITYEVVVSNVELLA